MKKLLILLVAVCLLTSCEDDPIIEPVDDGSSCSGSYCKLAFPDSTDLQKFYQLQ